MTTKSPALLIIDDVEDNRYTLIRRLKREGYDNLITAENGSQALEVLQQQHVDLILLDIMMPGISGYEVLETTKQNPATRDIPVIMISAVGEIDSVVRCIELGAEDYLQKPFNPVLLKARISATLEKKRLQDETKRQLDVIRKVFGKYVPPGIAEAIVHTEGAMEPVQTTATILYSDIEGFTGIVEGMDPTQVVQMLNEYFHAVIEPVSRHGGIVNQIQGDAMLITFNVPVDEPKHADKAVKAALEMQQKVQQNTFAGISLRTRIGINTGTVVAGNVGSGDRLSYTVHGDAVNVAARLEQLNKKYGTHILVSDNTASQLSETFPLESIGEVSIRGKDATISIHKITT